MLKNPFSQRRPDWHLQILMVNKPIRAALSMAIWSLLADLISLLSKQAQNAQRCSWSHITPAMMWAWTVSSLEFRMLPLPRSAHHCFISCILCVCVCVYIFLFYFFCICTSPFVLSQCQHPNHNYNVISRVRQCPRCCFTFSSSSLLWISNALMLGSESCTALSQAHTHVCVCVYFGGGWGWGVSWIVLSFSCFDRKSQQRDLEFKNTRSFPLVCCYPCPSKTTLHPIQLSSVGCPWHFLFMSHKLQTSQRLSQMQCEAICQSLGMAVVSNRWSLQGWCYASGLEKRASVKRSLKRPIVGAHLTKY